MWLAQPLTTDVEAVPVQGEGAQVGDALGLMARLPVESLSVQPWTSHLPSRCLSEVEGADDVHPSGCPTLLKPGGGRTWGHGILSRGPSGCGKRESGREESEGEAEGAALMSGEALLGVSHVRQPPHK